MKAVVVKVLFLRETNIDSSAEEEICGFNIVKQGRVSSAFLIQVPMQKNCKSRSITPLLDNMGWDKLWVRWNPVLTDKM